jgi:uncharacterized protein (TIGR03086 family)
VNDDAAAQVGARASEAMGFLVDAVEQIPSESWDQPSNLDGWSIRDLGVHTIGSAAKIVTLVEGGEVGQSPSEADDPAAQLRELAVRLEEALAGADLNAMRSSPQGEVPLHQALRFPIFGLTIHGWDVYQSQHRPVELPENLLAFCRQVVESVPEDELRRPGLFGPAKRVPEDATPTTRLMAYVGRSVDG